MSASSSRRLAIFLATIVGMSLVVTSAHSQVADHLKCYHVKDSLKLAGTVDLDTPQFGADAGCKISKATLFCVPATKTNVVVVDKATKQPITPLPVTGPDPGDRICYKVKCPAAVADQEATDQFGTRTLSKFKVALVCMPAVKGAPTTTTTTTTLPTCGRCWISVSDSCTGIICSSDLDCQAQPNMFCMPGRCPSVCVNTTSTTTTTSTTMTTVAGCGLPATGQTTCYDASGTVISCAGTGQDGDIQAGVSVSYVDNGTARSRTREPGSCGRSSRTTGASTTRT